MRVLLDENIPRRLRQHFDSRVEVRTVPGQGWSGKKNGELLRLAAPLFDVFVTMDRSIEYQQNLIGVQLGIVLLKAPSNQLDDLLPLMPSVHDVLTEIREGQLIHVSS